MIIDLLRHGALKGGVKYRGRVEGDLTQEGREAMNQVWQKISKDVAVIITSPLRRCAEPAQAWAKEKGIPCITDIRVAEMNYGDWEDKSHDEIEGEYPGMLALWRENPTGMRPPNGESPEELQMRIADFWQDLCVKHIHQHVLVVGHSGSTRMLIAHIEGKPIVYTRELAMPYACWSRASHDDTGHHMLFIDG